MGVKSCNRNKCTSIMCDTHIQSVGYVCNDCQDEFKKWLIATNKNPQTEAEIVKALNLFLGMPKSGYQCDDKISVNDFFKKHTD